MKTRENVTDIKTISRHLFFTMLSLVIVVGIVSSDVFGDVIIDNGDGGTSSTGTWRVSGGTTPYEEDSLWARDGVTYTWSFDNQPAGSYEVLMWWSEWVSRATDIDVAINYFGGTEIIGINQQENTGQWYSLGTYNFGTSGSVTITAANGSTVSTCADAVWFRSISTNTPPAAIIDSIGPNPADVGESVSFAGHGEDVDGTIQAYNWTSSIDDFLSDTNSFSTEFLSEGSHIISFRAQDDDGVWSETVTDILTVGQPPTETIIDNLDTDISWTGTWNISGGANPYEADSFWSRDGDTFTWYFTPVQAGEYEISMWWTQWSSRSDSVPVDIEYSGGTDTVFINQQQNGGQWNPLDSYFFEQGVTYSVTITSQPGPSSTCADAVRCVYLGSGNTAPTATIDSISPNPASAGETVSFAGHGTDSDGIIAGCSWSSNIDGDLGDLDSFSMSSLSSGQHTISFRVRDDEGMWSDPVSEELVVLAGSGETIVDNLDADTSWTGTWRVSGGDDPYGADSFWSRDGDTFTWYFTPAQNGEYEISMWWTEYPSRSDSVRVNIGHSTGTGTATINQQENGGQWNALGSYVFLGGVTYAVTITSSTGSSSTCADAIRCVYVGPGGGGNIAPTATIASISPNPAEVGQTVFFSGYGTDSDGTIAGYNWRSNIGGYLSNLSSFSKSNLSAGTHIIYFSVQDNAGAWSQEVSRTLDVTEASTAEEHIYISPSYGGPEYLRPLYESALQNMGAYPQGDVWIYENQLKTYVIHFAESFSSLTQALQTPGAHIILAGHANYGLGPLFATAAERNKGIIEAVRYIDDDRILNLCTPWAHVSVRGMRTGQVYPFWWPVFKNGTNGIMPYDFNDPRGDPPYNYYITYQVPGDPTHYKIETVRNSAIERFSDSRTEPWYSADGSEPDPANPSHLKYYITNTADWSPSFESVGNWVEIFNADEDFFKENYLLTSAGSGNRQAKFLFSVPAADNYNVSAWWPQASSRSSDVPFTVINAAGSTTVRLNQRVNGGRWNQIGQFYFDTDDYSVTITDNTSTGNVAADAIQISHPDNPPDVVQADFVAMPTSGQAPLNVQFINTSTGDLTARTWSFGDGLGNTTRDYIEHQFTSPGTYTVSLSVSGPTGNDSITKTNYITVGGVTPPLRADFSTRSNKGEIPLSVSFQDFSTSGVSEPNGIVSWQWNFGDGQTSYQQNPRCTYTEPGNYPVTLTVTNINGQSNTLTKPNYVRAVVFEKRIDNVDYPKTHYRDKTLIYTGGPEVDKNTFRYSRMLYESCNSGNYYLGIFSRGLTFYTVANSGGQGSILYLQAYLEGRSDEEIWQIIQGFEPAYDFYNFNAPPPALTTSAAAVSTLRLAAAAVPTAVTLTPQEEEKIQQLRGLSVAEVFDRLKQIDFIVNDNLLKQAISATFVDTKNEAIALSMDYVKLPLREEIDDMVVSRTMEFFVAKKILQVFPDDSVPKLLELYNSNNTIAKANVIRASGPMANISAVKDLLIIALDDKTATVEEEPELVGEPLRICDIAYNQLALNLKIRDVLRVIGTGHSTETRDYHIDILKSKL